jgi:hypothetical protein
MPTLAPTNGRGVQVVTLGEIVLIHDLKRQGLTVSAIARKVGLDRKTVRRHLERGMEPPAYGPRAPRPRQLAPYEAYLRERIAAWPELTGKRLLREIRELGYEGCENGGVEQEQNAPGDARNAAGTCHFISRASLRRMPTDRTSPAPNRGI